MNNEWMPIDTAPRDGTMILFWRKLGRVGLGFYRDGHIWTGTVVPLPSAIAREWEDVATHWMRLPPAPHMMEN